MGEGPKRCPARTEIELQRAGRLTLHRMELPIRCVVRWDFERISARPPPKPGP